MGISFCIYSFMLDELGLSGGELLIYAIIYSFTKGDVGLFYGAQEYLARTSGMSVSSVKRLLASLLSKGYIERCKVMGLKGYRATDAAERGTNINDEASDADTGEASRGGEGTPRHRATALGAPDGYKPSPHRAEHPKYNFLDFGRDGMISMTAEQHAALLRLVSHDVLQFYIRRLELLIRDKGYRTFSPYKTIKKWIIENAEV